MRKVFLLILAIILLDSTAHAHDVLVIQGLRVKPHEEAFRGFRNRCGADTRRLYLPELEGTDIVRLVKEERPRVILAIGPDALKRVRPVKDVPIIYLMVVNPQQIVKGSRNVSGVSMNVPPEKFVELLARMSPKPKLVGVIYDPAKTGQLVKRAQQAALAQGIELAAREVSSPQEVPEALSGIKGIVDGLWMIPDTTVVTPETVELFLMASQENNIPVISFAGKYIEKGAAAALDIDSFDQGQQAGELAAKVLNGVPVSALPGMEARSTTLKVNRSVTKKLRVSFGNSEASNLKR